ncbi:MAG: 3'-5' exonuclease domain-containing protein 2 [Muribaculaceae bacterium]|nr:3'-5' exonuclease domain-containing protein 2 [Muribaculaceae bacterium]
MTPGEFERAIITISKEHLATLPAAEYPGEICLIDRKNQVADAVSELKESKIIGFDTETRPSFKRGQHYSVSLIQLATPDKCFLFRTNLIGYPKELIKLIEDPEILKVGLSIHDDFINLRKSATFSPQGFVDLQSFVKEFKIADNSLSRVYAILFGKRISKGQRLTNWEANELTQQQKIYASLDANACIQIYQFLKDGKFDPHTSEYLVLPPEPIEEIQEIKEGEE